MSRCCNRVFAPRYLDAPQWSATLVVLFESHVRVIVIVVLVIDRVVFKRHITCLWKNAILEKLGSLDTGAMCEIARYGKACGFPLADARCNDVLEADAIFSIANKAGLASSSIAVDVMLDHC